MKGKNLISLFWKRFFYTLLVLFTVVTAGYIGYLTTISYYKGTGQYASVKTNDESKLIKARAEEVSKNLIFSVNDKTGKIDHLLLEVFNTQSLNITYVKIPANTQYTMSGDLYQEISEKNADVPQTVTVANMFRYFDESSVFDYTVLILNEMLDMEASYYSVLSQKDFESIYGKHSIKKSFIEKLDTLDSEKKYTDYITSFYERIQTNLPLKKKLIYVPYFMQMNEGTIKYETIAGRNVGNYYTLDIKKSHTQIQNIIYFVKK